MSKSKNQDAGAKPSPVVIEASIREILDALQFRTVIGGINLHEEVKNPDFRFVSSMSPDESQKLSAVLARFIQESKIDGFNEGVKMGSMRAVGAAVKKRQENADDFAKNMFSIVQEMKTVHGVETMRETVATLNENEIKSPRGGQWNLSSLQLMQKRWEKLGLI